MDQNSSSLLKRTTLLFLISYLLLYMFPFPLDTIPVVGDVFGFYSNFMDFLTLWFGKFLLHLSTLQKIEMTGSGDTTLDWVKLLFYLVLAACSTVIILLVDRKKNNYSTAYSYVLLYARYYLGLYLLSYGFAKLFAAQFPAPSPGRMEQTFGSASPMGLLWAFMGASKGYVIFSGIMELIAGYLLLFRRTRTLGALVSLLVMGNVMMMNFCYDVPVKQFSAHLVFISLLILGPDLNKIFRFFLGLAPASLEYEPLVFDKRYKRLIVRWGKGVLLMFFTLLFFDQGFDNLDDPQPKSAGAKYTGAYNTSLLVFAKDTLLSPRIPFIRKMVINDKYLSFTSCMDTSKGYTTTFDTVSKTVKLTSTMDTTQIETLAYRAEKDKLILSGKWKGKDMYAEFIKKDPQKYLLTNRGFHWINEYPYNR
jgi:uncharacterized membrane protein YphA (DoxX/SURF4 family)